MELKCIHKGCLGGLVGTTPGSDPRHFLKSPYKLALIAPFKLLAHIAGYPN